MIQDRSKIGEVVEIQRTYMQRDKDGYLRLIIVDSEGNECVLSEATGSHGYMQQITPKDQDFYMKDVEKINQIKKDMETVSDYASEAELRDKAKELNFNPGARRFA